MKNWLYNNKEIISLDSFENQIYGFIYKITNEKTGKIYVGKKQILSITNKKLGKKEMANMPIQRGRKVTKKQIIKESNWLDYWGSNKFLLEDIKNQGYENFTREIIHLCYNKKELTYFEIAYQIKNDVLFINSYNDNCLGKFFRKDFSNLNLDIQ